MRHDKFQLQTNYFDYSYKDIITNVLIKICCRPLHTHKYSTDIYLNKFVGDTLQ